MNTIFTDLQESIKKNLPAEIGNQLRQRLEEADKTDDELKKAKEEIDKLKSLLEESEQMIVNYKALEAKAIAIIAREDEIVKKERNYEILAAKDKQKCAEEKSIALFELVKLVFRSPVYSRQLNTRAETNSYYKNGTTKYIPNGNKSETETISEL